MDGLKYLQSFLKKRWDLKNQQL